MLSIVLKVIAVIDFILSFVGGIVVGKTINTLLGLCIGSQIASTSSWQLMLTIWIAGFLQGIIFLTLSAILYRLELLGENDEKILRRISKDSSKNESQTKDNQPHPSVMRPRTLISSAKKQWVCKKCGSTNEASAQFCKDCGAYK